MGFFGASQPSGDFPNRALVVNPTFNAVRGPHGDYEQVLPCGCIYGIHDAQARAHKHSACASPQDHHFCKLREG